MAGSLSIDDVGGRGIGGGGGDMAGGGVPDTPVPESESENSAA